MVTHDLAISSFSLHDRPEILRMDIKKGAVWLSVREKFVSLEICMKSVSITFELILIDKHSDFNMQ